MRPEFRLHHIGHAVKSLESAAKDYIARFAYTVSSPVIHDPAQTARVQFLRLPGESSWLELVAPDGPASKLAAVVAKGGGLHHLCYTVDSLELAIAHLEETGLRLIADPVAAVAFAGRRICWMLGPERALVELVERRADDDGCVPGLSA